MKRHTSLRAPLFAVGIVLWTLISATCSWAGFPSVIGATGDQEVIDLVVDDDGATYMVGIFDGTIAGASENIGTRGLKDVFVAKLNRFGDLVWLKTAGGASIDEGSALALVGGDVYFAGFYSNRMTFGGASPISTSLEEHGDAHGDLFVAKLDGSNGDLLWAARGSGAGRDLVTGLSYLPGDATVFPPIPDRMAVVGSFQCDLRFFDEDGDESTRAEPFEAPDEDCVGVQNGRRLPFVATITFDGAWLGRFSDVATLREDPENPVGVAIEGLAANSDHQIYAYGEMRSQVDFDLSSGATERFHPGSPGPPPNFSPLISSGNTGFEIATNRVSSPPYSAYAPPQSGPIINRLMRTDPFGVEPTDEVIVEWRHAYTFAPPEGNNCQAGSLLEVTYSNGSSELISEDAYTEGAPNGSLNSSPNHSVFCGESPQWPGMSRSRALLPAPATSTSALVKWVAIYPQSQDNAGTGWWVDDVKVIVNGEVILETSFPQPPDIDSNTQGHFVSRLAADGSGWDWVVRTPDGVDPRDITVDQDEAVLLAGDKEDAASFPLEGGGADTFFLNPGVFVAEMRDTGSTGAWQWARAMVGGKGQGIHSENNFTYLAGSFDSGLVREQDPVEALFSEGGEDIFIAKLDTDGNWFPGGPESLWGDERSSLRAGGTDDDVANALTGNGEGQLYVAGRFAGVSQFGTADSGRVTATDGGHDAVIANLDTDGRFATAALGTWVVGVPLVAPVGAEVEKAAFVPDFLDHNGDPFEALGTYFKWSPPLEANDGKAQLIPIRPLPSQVEVQWRVEDQPLESSQRLSTFGQPAWPTARCNASTGVTSSCYQVHLAGAPVEILPGQGNPERSFLEIHRDSGSDAQVANGAFTASTSGFSTLVYVKGPTLDSSQHPLDVRVVRTVQTTDLPPSNDDLPYLGTAACTIGTEIVPDPADHNQVGRAGYVLNVNAFYDGVGARKPYDRQARLGQIVPVNRVNSNRPEDADKEMLIAWYRLNDLGVAWPEKAVGYQCAWPSSPQQIVIASELGSEGSGQPALDPLTYPQIHFYVQDDPTKPGFNPNDEHALMAPSNSDSGVSAIFALRADFGGAIDASAASEPYVIAKHFDDGAQRWVHEVYAVKATSPEFPGFSYPGFAGRTVEPPYPVRLQESCAETRIVGEVQGTEQPPIPFFRDTNEQLWARAAGSGKVLYHYPVQPGWFYDLDNDGVMDDLNGDGTPGNEVGTCIPWMARLAAADGGTVSPATPIEVAYNIAWPDAPPQLTVGETLLTPKKELPDIFNQAAVRVVYDQLQEANPLDPSKNLTQLIDPLNARSAALEQLPTGTQALAVRLDDQGKTIITGNAAGDLRLPYALYSRLRWDALTKTLSFSGHFDETGAGDPLLLLNVMTTDERNQLLALSSSLPWQTAIHEIYELSRNPHGVQKVCTATSVADGAIRCDASRPVDLAQDVLIGVVDTNDDGILEPYRAEGVKAALTAGSAQSTGYVTVAFNDSRNLALPISLEVIKVDCLTFPEPPAPPTLVSPYIGQIQVIAPANVFDEQVTLRHNGDFGGRVESLEFQWFRHPDVDGTPPTPLPDPENGNFNNWTQLSGNKVEITLGGADIQTLSDNWFLARYRGLPTCNNATEWTVFAGQPGSTPTDPRAQLSVGWVKRVVAGLNPFDARVAAFHTSATNTYASMIAQLGERYEGPIAFSDDPENLNRIGLIEAYETVFRRAMELSIDSTPPVNYEPANAALLNIASRIADFYMLLGNEAFSDAQDPTVGISTSNGDFGSLAPTIFNFQNQAASLLEEELTLLRGRDDGQGPVAASPVYNRYFWNFTQGDGEVAYALSYNLSDQNMDGFINEHDARLLYPQGHGDAWGHYLTAIKTYYKLLRHDFYTWNPRPEAVPVAGAPIQVDYLDERKFARAAALRARAGAEIVDLTYRSEYVEDPAGQWQGYKDTNPDRAWGLDGWGRRAGQGALFDWVTANAILPAEDPDPSHVGIQKIDRTTVQEIEEIAAGFTAVQSQLDEADRGLNPLGLAKGVVPFDIDPAQVDAGVTHFEQVYDRAVTAVENTVKVWNFANQQSRMLRFNQDSVEELALSSQQRERDFRNRLIESFGRPYPEDVGPGGTYPANYDGPDIYHYNYVDAPALAGTPFEVDPLTGEPEGPAQIGRLRTFTATYKPMPGGINFFDFNTADQSLGCADNPFGEGCTLGDPPDTELEVTQHTWDLPVLSSFANIKPPTWTGNRPAAGKIQEALSEIMRSQIAMRRALDEYDDLRQAVQGSVDSIKAQFNLRNEQLRIKNSERKELNEYAASITAMESTVITLKRVGAAATAVFNTAKECIPSNMIAGVAAGGDVFSPVKCAAAGVSNALTLPLDTLADGITIAQNAAAAAKEDVSLQAAIELEVHGYREEMDGLVGEVEVLLREEPLLRNELFARAQVVEQAKQAYRNALAEGLRTYEELVAFRKNTAAAVQDYRHQDMAFRVFRNDALQKYRSAFDMAARFTYLAATAYDYDTNLLGSNADSGRDFLADIVRRRGVGQILGGAPVPGSLGLADPLGRMHDNFQILKGQMGFNNPQIETNRFSLRRGLFRLFDAETSDIDWRAKLLEHRVDDLWQVPEFRRLARPFTEEALGPQPGLVIPFETTVTFGLNFFGRPLAAGDSAYDPSQFSTRVRSLGVWLDGYGELPLSITPRVYLIPAGFDVLRPPTAGEFTTREWAVRDQLVPVPFALADEDLEDPNWTPLTDMLSGGFDEVRRFGSFRAYDYDPNAPFGDQTTGDSRSVARSVWNTRWLLIIPGGTLLADPREGVDKLIGTPDDPGVTDILIFFKTYAYSGF